MARANSFRMLVAAMAAILAACLLGLAAKVEPAEAAFPGNNGRIAFASDRNDSQNDLNTMRSTDGKGVRRLTTTGFVEDSDWNPRGTRIAFSDQDINVAKPDGTIFVTVYHPSNGAKDLSPAWNPAGTRIAFSGVRSRGGSDRDIYTVKADGTDLRLLTRNTAQEGLKVDWSSTGKIAFERDGNIYTMNADGSGVKLVTGDPNGGGERPEWSPDGTRIAYQRGFEIRTMNANGSDKALLTSEGLIADYPSWSPDGTKIAFQSTPISSDYETYTVPSSGGASTQLTNNTSNDTAPAWQPIIP